MGCLLKYVTAILNQFSFFLPYPVTVNSYITTPIPIAYNNSPTTDPLCIIDRGSLSCARGALLVDSDTGSAQLHTNEVFAWDREVSITSVILSSKVRQVNLFYNIPSTQIGLPPAELFWSDVNPTNPDNPLFHVIVGNQDLSQDDRTLRNVSFVVTTDQDNPEVVPTDYRFFRIHFTFPIEASLIDWILLSEVQLCGEAGRRVIARIETFHWKYVYQFQMSEKMNHFLLGVDCGKVKGHYVYQLLVHSHVAACSYGERMVSF